MLQQLLRADGALGEDVVVIGAKTRPRARVDGLPIGGSVGGSASIQRLVCVTEGDIQAIRQSTMDAVSGIGVPSESEIDAALVGCSVLVRASLCSAAEEADARGAGELELAGAASPPGSPARPGAAAASQDSSLHHGNGGVVSTRNRNGRTVGAAAVAAAIRRVRGMHNQITQQRNQRSGSSPNGGPGPAGDLSQSLVRHRTFGFKPFRVGASDPPDLSTVAVGDGNGDSDELIWAD